MTLVQLIIAINGIVFAVWVFHEGVCMVLACDPRW